LGIIALFFLNFELQKVGESRKISPPIFFGDFEPSKKIYGNNSEQMFENAKDNVLSNPKILSKICP